MFPISWCLDELHITNTHTHYRKHRQNKKDSEKEGKTKHKTGTKQDQSLIKGNRNRPWQRNSVSKGFTTLVENISSMLRAGLRGALFLCLKCSFESLFFSTLKRKPLPPTLAQSKGHFSFLLASKWIWTWLIVSIKRRSCKDTSLGSFTALPVAYRVQN